MTHSKKETVRLDVLIIGGGAAGTRAAIEAAKFGVTVGLIDKGRVGRSGSSPTSGGSIAAAYGANNHKDNTAAYEQDVLSAGEQMSDPALVRILADEVNDRVKDLEFYGDLRLKNDSDEYLLYPQLGSNTRRCIKAHGKGHGMMQVLRKEVLNREVQIFQKVTLCKIICKNNQIIGALAIDLNEFKFIIFDAPCLILATGSATDLYTVSNADFKVNGDGLALAYEAGVKLVNMEFVEFSLSPVIGLNPIPCAGIGTAIGMGGKFYNALGERFMAKVDSEQMEKTSRSRLVRAIFKENSEGRGPVMMDATRSDWSVLEKIDHYLVKKLQAGNVDYKKELFEWKPSVLSLLGGIKIDKHCNTGIKGLFAAGEIIGSIHGAERLSGAALADSQVFGRRAGISAGFLAMEEKLHGSDNGPELRRQSEKYLNKFKKRIDSAEHKSKIRINRIKNSIREIMTRYVGPVRDAEGLSAAAAGINKQEKILQDCRVDSIGTLSQWNEAMSMIRIAQLITAAAMIRTESRGSHFRSDFPDRDDKNWKKWIVLQKNRENNIQIDFKRL